MCFILKILNIKQNQNTFNNGHKPYFRLTLKHLYKSEIKQKELSTGNKSIRINRIRNM